MSGGRRRSTRRSRYSSTFLDPGLMYRSSSRQSSTYYEPGELHRRAHRLSSTYSEPDPTGGMYPTHLTVGEASRTQRDTAPKNTGVGFLFRGRSESRDASTFTGMDFEDQSNSASQVASTCTEGASIAQIATRNRSDSRDASTCTEDSSKSQNGTRSRSGSRDASTCTEGALKDTRDVLEKTSSRNTLKQMDRIDEDAEELPDSTTPPKYSDEDFQTPVGGASIGNLLAVEVYVLVKKALPC